MDQPSGAGADRSQAARAGRGRAGNSRLRRRPRQSEWRAQPPSDQRRLKQSSGHPRVEPASTTALRSPAPNRGRAGRGFHTPPRPFEIPLSARCLSGAVGKSTHRDTSDASSTSLVGQQHLEGARAGRDVRSTRWEFAEPRSASSQRAVLGVRAVQAPYFADDSGETLRPSRRLDHRERASADLCE